MCCRCCRLSRIQSIIHSQILTPLTCLIPFPHYHLTWKCENTHHRHLFFYLFPFPKPNHLPPTGHIHHRCLKCPTLTVYVCNHVTAFSSDKASTTAPICEGTLLLPARHLFFPLLSLSSSVPLLSRDLLYILLLCSIFSFRIQNTFLAAS